MVVSLDHGLKDDVHPTIKYPIAHRLALLALSNLYGYTSIEARSPECRDLKYYPKHLLLSFSGTSFLKTSDGSPLRGFEVVTLDGKSHSLTGESRGRMSSLVYLHH